MTSRILPRKIFLLLARLWAKQRPRLLRMRVPFQRRIIPDQTEQRHLNHRAAVETMVRRRARLRRFADHLVPAPVHAAYQTLWRAEQAELVEAEARRLEAERLAAEAEPRWRRALYTLIGRR